MPRNIHNILTDWGRGKRRSPARNEILKAEILTRVPAGNIPTVNHSLRRLPWLSFAFTSLAAIILVVNAVSVNYSSRTMMVSAPTAGVREEGSGSFAMPNSIVQDSRNSLIRPWPSPSPGGSITDTREFLKKDYNAQVRTRKIDELAGRIQTMVRGYDGRIDGYSASEKYGYVSFAIPASKLEAFRAEIKSIIRAKFYTEYVSSQNLLPQKQSIEQEQSQIEKTLGQLRADRDKLMIDHKKTLSSLQSQLNAANKELAALRAEVTDDPERRAQIDARIAQLQPQKITLESRVYNENKNYEANLVSFDSQIASAESNLEAVEKQDQNLLDNVATVQGYITLNWISLWEIMDLYLPGPLLTWILGALALTAYLWHRHRSHLLIP
ncbi:MAG: hypothetical protein A2751_02240 [Candidatus Doudnabacteria bacterium RIFCSPHIGHO2_01_FULL_46_14]|uniref:DUF4349 domain-containing protein n=1 Tax=Candidatus Doudnabacteria bacterium RIFCSPHIGHO2_01_FULL_46_14 TaxID=1817824 RepID=A0A1F5NJW3_9BACT|nr:MAG: hypothetical protein A2751_02240 [Candidatus Doudnabacteria bacterium RIFCSPHIGHO2_01_FULL_46_14]